ncbi:AMP-binding protein [Streptomyces sp. NPDC058439]|uniref:AMP-binding protein n=1 Tax=Streptomyces sp. NPDC058439 TaxID=3346500 RepID=UPI00364ECACB
MSTTGPRQTMDVRTLPDALRLRSEKQPDETAYIFLHNGEEPSDALTYRELHNAVGQRAAAFLAAGLAGGSAVLLYPSGLEFVRALLGCMYGRVAGAPVQVPRRRDEVERLRRIADDAGTSTVLTTTEVVHDLQERFSDMLALAGLTFLATDALADAPDAAVPAPPDPEDTALLQYTSGSTGDPKGVVVSHANFLANVVETDELWPCEPDGTVVSWLPLFHDMGMLFGVVMPLWAGIPSYLMAPDAFIRRPARWLEAIARFGGTHAAAPSFAYELCVQAATQGKTYAVGDLSRWRVAANGAEPVRWATIRSFAEAFAPNGFNPQAMCPGYGLAENTLKATGSRHDREPTVLWVSTEALREGTAQPVGERATATLPLVSSGAAVGRTRLQIVDPTTRQALPDGRVGEIWVNGPCVAGGYLGRPVVSEETFRARVSGAEGADDDTYLRTGDLGFLYDAELYRSWSSTWPLVRGSATASDPRERYPIPTERTPWRRRRRCASRRGPESGRSAASVWPSGSSPRCSREPGPPPTAGRSSWSRWTPRPVKPRCRPPWTSRWTATSAKSQEYRKASPCSSWGSALATRPRTELIWRLASGYGSGPTSRGVSSRAGKPWVRTTPGEKPR